MATQARVTSSKSHWRLYLSMTLIILALLGFSVGIGITAGSGRDRWLLLMLAPPLGIIFLAIAVNAFELMVACIPLAALAIPFMLSTGTETRLPVSLLLSIALCGIWVASMMIRKRLDVTPSPLNLPFLLFSITCIISLVWGIAWRDPVLIRSDKFIMVQLASLVTYIVSIGAALLVGRFMQSPRQLRVMVIMFIALGGLMALKERLHLPLGFLNDGGLWGMWTVVPAIVLLFAKEVRWYWKAPLAGVIAVTMYQTMIVNADWVSGWLPTIVGVYIAMFLRSKKWFVVFLVIGVVGFFISRSFFATVAQDNIDDGSLERLSLWQQNWSVVRAHWLFGTGPAGYAPYYMTYYRDDARSTHNNYLDILAQFGFVGMAIWLWLTGTALWEGYRLVRRAPEGFLKSVAIMATAGWGGAQFSMFLGDWILPFAYNQGIGGYKYTVYSWLFLGTLIAVRAILDRQQPKPLASATSPILR